MKMKRNTLYKVPKSWSGVTEASPAGLSSPALLTEGPRGPTLGGCVFYLFLIRHKSGKPFGKSLA